jgi:hypothetical protein
MQTNTEFIDRLDLTPVQEEFDELYARYCGSLDHAEAGDVYLEISESDIDKIIKLSPSVQSGI